MKRKLSQTEIDNIVVAQANEDSAWDKPIRVRRKKSAAVVIPAELANRVAFLAGLHHEENFEKWIAQIIQERVELEEAAFAGAKRELVRKNSG